MKKILFLTGSNSPQSINRLLVRRAEKIFSDIATSFLELREYKLPIYSLKIEENGGVPKNAIMLRKEISEYDGYVISVPENNGSVPAFFKNTLDWISRCDDNYHVFENKPVLLLGTSPSPDGAKRSLSHAETIISTLAGNITHTFSLPLFYEVTTTSNGRFDIIDNKARSDLEKIVSKFEASFKENIS